MLNSNHDEQIFGNDSDIQENYDEEIGHNLSQNPLYMESDVDEKETFDDTDYFGDNNEEYKQASPFPIIKCPDEKTLENYE